MCPVSRDTRDAQTRRVVSRDTRGVPRFPRANLPRATSRPFSHGFEPTPRNGGTPLRLPAILGRVPSSCLPETRDPRHFFFFADLSRVFPGVVVARSSTRFRPFFVVAVKYEEVEQDVPSLSKLRKCASNVYSVDIIRKMELAVLIELDWELSRVCSAHFLEAVLALTGGGTFPHDDIGDRQWTNACCAQLRKLCGFLHSICLQDGHIGARAGEPSRLAAAIVATARLQLGIYPVWPAELRAATGYACDTLGPAMSSIMKLYKDSLPPSGIGNGGGVENEGGGVEETNAFFETDDKAYERAGGPGGYESGSGSLGSAATREVSVMSADGVFQGDLDVVRSGKYADDEGHREFLTPSPTGPLDTGMFFDEAPMSTEAPAA